MKNTFIAAMFIFWGFVIAVVSAGYVVKQNRLAQESMQKTYTDSVKQIASTMGSQNSPTAITPVVVPTPTPVTTTLKPMVTTPGKVTTPTPTPVTPSGPTMATVAQHSTQSDCWIVISGNVYSVASYIPMHPGGSQRIINQCGGDATAMFEGTGGRGAHRHSSYAFSLLGQYLVGTLQ